MGKVCVILAVLSARATAFALRLLGRRATSMPGLVALRLCPGLLGHLLRQLDAFVVVTGTNGKTTTVALLHAILDGQDQPWIFNDGGANLTQGLVSALLPYTAVSGALRHRRALLEVDEATLPGIVRLRAPTLLVVTNVLRDQLDRYGEVDHALACLRAGVRDASTTLVANADDPLCASLGLGRDLTYYFGIADAPQDGVARSEARDGAFCLQCGAELEYTRFVFAQMGDYRCPAGHFARPERHVAGSLPASDAGRLGVSERLSGSRPVDRFDLPLTVAGLYNVYNLLAAVTAARVLGYSPARIERGLGFYRAPTGRMQTVCETPRVVLSLIKNPAGATAVLRAIEADAVDKTVCFVINDADADGRDVSWLWDIDLESFVPRAKCAVWWCAGTRGPDMALRLAYAGVERSAITVVAQLDLVPGHVMHSGEPVYVLSTYTALHALSDMFAVQRGRAV